MSVSHRLVNLFQALIVILLLESFILVQSSQAESKHIDTANQENGESSERRHLQNHWHHHKTHTTERFGVDFSHVAIFGIVVFLFMAVCSLLLCLYQKYQKPKIHVDWTGLGHLPPNIVSLWEGAQKELKEHPTRDNTGETTAKETDTKSDDKTNTETSAQTDDKACSKSVSQVETKSERSNTCGNGH